MDRLKILIFTIANFTLFYMISLLSFLVEYYSSTTYAVKIKSTFLMGYLLSPLLLGWEMITRWRIENIDYITVVLWAIAIDHLLGTIKYLFFLPGFSLKENIKGLIVKVALVVACGILFEGLSILVTHDSTIKEYLIIMTRIMVFLYPAMSAFNSSSIISGGKFPPKGWMDRLRNFQSDLKTKHFRDE